MKVRGPWRADTLRSYLRDTVVPLRLAVLRSDGTPLVVSLWFAFEDDALWCATASDALVAKRLVRDPRCGFEVAGDAPPYRGVRGFARATLVPERGKELLASLISRYLGDAPTPLSRWLLARERAEVAICVRPEAWTTWDYRARMKGGDPPR